MGHTYCIPVWKIKLPRAPVSHVTHDLERNIRRFHSLARGSSGRAHQKPAKGHIIGAQIAVEHEQGATRSVRALTSWKAPATVSGSASATAMSCVKDDGNWGGRCTARCKRWVCGIKTARRALAASLCTHLRIGMQKQQHFSVGDDGAGVLLRGRDTIDVST